MATTSSTDSSLSPQRLLGKVALVTGGATGIGESIARLFCKHGAKVCIADLQDNLGQNVCESLGGETNTCYIHCDVTIEDDVCQAVDFTVDKFGTLDIMVNNAGLGGPPCPDIRKAALSDFEKVFDVNVKGAFLGMKHAARIMIPLNKGSIVSLGSVSSALGGLGPHAYTGSKHAVLGLTRSVAAELGKHGIRVNCVSPYGVPTGLAVAHLPEQSCRERDRERERQRPSAMSFAASRVFKACRAVLAPAKSAAVASKATATKTTAASPKPKPKAKAKTTSTTPGSPRGILMPKPVSPVLGDFLGGVPESSRADAVKKIWAHIKLHNLQNPTNKKEIICDAKLKVLFDGRDKVGFLDIGKLLSAHFPKAS